MRKNKVLLLHGWGGSDNPHWQSWLAGEIAKDYGCVSFLEFSNYDFPVLDTWRKELKEHLESFKPDIVICHSLANILWFHLCNDKDINTTVKKLFLVAPPSLNSEIDEVKTFFPLTPPTDLYADEALLITSTNDPYLTVKEAQELKEALGIEMEMLQDAGHINADSGFGEWDWIKNRIKEK